MFQVKDDKKHKHLSLIILAVVLVTVGLLVRMIPHFHRETLPASEVDITKHVSNPVKHEHKCHKRKLHYLVIDNIDCNLTDSSIKVAQTTYRNGKKVQVLHNDDTPKVMSVDVQATTNFYSMNGVGVAKQEVHGGQ